MDTTLDAAEKALGGTESREHEEYGVAGWMRRLLPHRDRNPTRTNHSLAEPIHNASKEFLYFKCCMLLKLVHN